MVPTASPSHREYIAGERVHCITMLIVGKQLASAVLAQANDHGASHIVSIHVRTRWIVKVDLHARKWEAWAGLLRKFSKQSAHIWKLVCFTAHGKMGVSLVNAIALMVVVTLIS